MSNLPLTNDTLKTFYHYRRHKIIAILCSNIKFNVHFQMPIIDVKFIIDRISIVLSKYQNQQPTQLFLINLFIDNFLQNQWILLFLVLVKIKIRNIYIIKNISKRK